MLLETSAHIDIYGHVCLKWHSAICCTSIHLSFSYIDVDDDDDDDEGKMNEQAIYAIL